MDLSLGQACQFLPVQNTIAVSLAFQKAHRTHLLDHPKKMPVAGFQDIGALREIEAEDVSLGNLENKLCCPNLQWIMPESVFPYMLSHPVGHKPEEFDILQQLLAAQLHPQGDAGAFCQRQHIVKSRLLP